LWWRSWWLLSFCYFRTVTLWSNIDIIAIHSKRHQKWESRPKNIANEGEKRHRIDSCKDILWKNTLFELMLVISNKEQGNWERQIAQWI
jgi:hypothetical protein